MRKSNITVVFKADIHTVWDVVTNNEDYAWRSDLSKIVISKDGNRFTEYTKDGYRTDFFIRIKKPHSRYEFDMENKNFTGHWIGTFSETQDQGTEINFTEELHIKSPVLELLSHLFMNLKQMQATYVEDLKKKLGE
jgi:hypothetical protein